jgi:hypothetical protein
MDDELIKQAKDYARHEGKSISQIVSDYFIALRRTQPKERKAQLKPRSQQLLGCLKESQVSEGDYRAHLEEKYL